MEEQKDALLQQIFDNNKESTVYLEIEIDDSENFELDSEYPDIITATGFYVEPDKIVTTIAVLANAENVVAFSSNQYETIREHATSRLGKKQNEMDIFPLRQHKNVQINGTEDITIEGVTTYDAKNNLVLLKVTNTGVPLSIGNSDTIQIGDSVYITGYHLEMGYQGRIGYIQGRYGDNIRYEVKTEFITGAFGSPAMNKNNEVIGVATTGLDSDVEDLSTMSTIMVSSNVINTLIANSGNVIPLAQWKKNARVRAYNMESKGDKYADFNYDREALNAYNSARKLNPGLCGIHARIARMKSRLGNYVGALKDFDKAIKENPYDIFSYNNRASTKGALGDLHDMLDDLNQALQMNPNYILGRLNRGQAKCMMAEFEIGDENIAEAQRLYQEAIDDFTKLLRLNPKQTFVRRRLRTVERTLRRLNSMNKKRSLLNS
ncbi:trypsin-like peptidase domain-containing protein [Candidatus Poribacteria bacterium]|nr:trypsin-like peptidase domain-containing protein [Candidatus Poribacteria bacterium]